MGTACCSLGFFSSLKTSDWLYISGMVVNSGLALFIIRTIQKRLTNKRVLKDHFINEVKDIRNEYRTCLNNLYSSKTHPKTVLPWFKLMYIKVGDMMDLINLKFKINQHMLAPFQIELRDLITENEDFIKHFKSDKLVVFSDKSKSQLIRFQQRYNHLFNDLIIKINDAD